MNKILFYSLFLLLSACARGYRAEPVAQKIQRYKSQEENINTIPLIPPLAEALPQAQGPQKSKERSPASEVKLQRLGHKRVYFLALYRQYLEFRSYLGNQSPPLNHCPRFHSSLIGQDLYQQELPLQFLKNDLHWPLTAHSSLAAHPELFLPLQEDGPYPTLADLKGSGNYADQLQQAISLHTRKLFGEIQELCEHGVSYNYYIFTNLIAHMNNHRDSTTPKELLQALTRTTLFSNRAILTSLQEKKMKGRLPASSTPTVPEESEAYRRLGSDWAFEYFSQLKRAEKN